MRPQQHGRRQRSRNNNSNRRNQNPLSRSYESNGPDVKIRGNAQQVADKYETLARDALSSGDRVIAENYLQHAEHYKRIIMAAQTQRDDENRDRRDGSDDNDRDDNDRQDSGAERNNKRDNDDDSDGNNGDDQPVIKGTPEEVKLEETEQTPKPAPRKSRARKAPPRKETSEPGDEAQPKADADGADEQPADPAPVKRRTRRTAKKVDTQPDDNSADEGNQDTTVDA